jgi:hypothetical protein
MTDAGGGGRDVELYERLRSHALGGEPSGFRLGLVVLERRGLAAWARAWQGTTPARAPQRPAASVVELPKASDELVGALASIALARAAAG